MPIVFWAIFYVESITGSAKKQVVYKHLDRMGTLHTLTMEYFLTPGDIHLTEGKVYSVNGSCFFEANTVPLVYPLTACVRIAWRLQAVNRHGGEG
jgi:hypothetical protein